MENNFIAGKELAGILESSEWPRDMILLNHFENDKKSSFYSARVYLLRQGRRTCLIFERQESLEVEKVQMIFQFENIGTVSLESMEDFEYFEEFELQIRREGIALKIKVKGKDAWYFTSVSFKKSIRLFSIYVSSDEAEKTIWLAKAMPLQCTLFSAIRNVSWKRERDLSTIANTICEAIGRECE